MKLLLVHNLKPGMIVGKDVYADRALLLTPAGATLTDKTISTLLLHSIERIYVKDKPTAVPPVASKKKEVPPGDEFQQFSKAFKRTTVILKNQINDVVTKNSSFRPEQLLAETSALFTPGMTTISLFDMLHHMRNYDDSTFVHCINVALICNVFGKWLNYDDKELEVLTLCGLLHDIGKLSIPDSIVKKAGKLTKEEYETMKHHPYSGYKLLKSHPELDPRIAQAALMHHERCDGTGYPLGCTRNTIPDVALIVAIADVYDAMTSKRVYRDALSPFKVIRMLEEEGMQKYDTYYFLTFLEQIVNTYVNTDVLLSNGQKAHVIYMNKNYLSKPVVQVGTEIIDLSKEKDLDIEAII